MMVAIFCKRKPELSNKIKWIVFNPPFTNLLDFSAIESFILHLHLPVFFKLRFLQVQPVY